MCNDCVERSGGGRDGSHHGPCQVGWHNRAGLSSHQIGSAEVCRGVAMEWYHQPTPMRRIMSVIPLKADIHQRGLHVRYVP